MTELPTQFMTAEQGSSQPVTEQVLNPQLAQARLRIQTIRRFKALKHEIANNTNEEEFGQSRDKLDALGKREYGKTWEILKNPYVEVFLLMIGGKTRDELKQKLTASGYKISIYAQQMMDNSDFATLSQPEPLGLVRLTVDNLGLPDLCTTDQLYARAEELGLKLCPPEVGPWYRLQTPSQPGGGEAVHVGMPLISAGDGTMRVFCMGGRSVERWLYENRVAPDSMWRSDNQFLFSLPLSQLDAAKVNHE